MHHALWAGLILLAAASTTDAQAPRAASAPSGQIESFFSQLQRASQSNDRNTIARMIRYPITIAVGGLRVPFSDAAALLERYDDIFTPALRDSIARRSPDVIVSVIDGQALITAVTVPPPADSQLPARPPEATSATIRKPETRRVAIRVGPRPTRIPGSLVRNGTDLLVLYLPKGRLAGIRLERVPAGAAVLRVVHAGTGALLEGRVSADRRYVSARPAEGADYRIEVRRISNVDENPLPYMLSLTLR